MALFIGKGGVGKTSVSAAYGVHKALQSSKHSVLLLSTDPAHSLADVFQKRFGDRPLPVKLAGRASLRVWQIDAEKRFRGFLDQRREEILTILESGSLFTRKELAPFLDATLPGMAEMAALLAIHDSFTSGRYSHIVVDTAPLGHTLRLFAMPGHFRKFLDFLEFAASRDQVLAEHFGGAGTPVGQKLLSDWQRMLADLREALLANARIFLVTTPENFALNESLRAHTLLRELSPAPHITGVILNRAILKAGNCRVCRGRLTATKHARILLRRSFPESPLHVAQDSGAPIFGVAGLRAFASHIFSGRPLAWKPRPPASARLRLRPAQWPVLKHPLTLFLGKGGVGKTTIAAAAALNTRLKGRRAVEICSVDPAPSLDDVFQIEVGDKPRPVFGDTKFRASEMDASKFFQKWAERAKESIRHSMTSERSQIHVDLRFERQLFERLLESVPPGLDEILAVFRLLDLLAAPATSVVIDMAPTGHALDLLRTPDRILVWTRLLLKSLAAHRKLAFVQDAGLQAAELGHKLRELIEVLGNSASSLICVVMLAESMPDRETERLIADLRRMDLPLGPLFVNRVLFPEDAAGCRRCRLAGAWQMVTLSQAQRRYSGMGILVCRNFPAEIAGKSKLLSFTSELWQLA